LRTPWKARSHKVEEVEPEDDEEDLEDALEGEVVDEE
jgi:hypothetical protein